MISVKLKFRPSVNIDKEGSLVFQLIHGRLVRRITSKYKIFSSEWDEHNGCIILPMKSSPRYEQLSLIRFNVEWELRRINSIIRDTVVDGSQLCVDDVISRFCFVTILSKACLTLSVPRLCINRSWARYVQARPISRR